MPLPGKAYDDLLFDKKQLIMYSTKMQRKSLIIKIKIFFKKQKSLIWGLTFIKNWYLKEKI